MQFTCRVMAVYFLSYIVDLIIISDNYAIYIGLGIFLVNSASPSPTPYHPPTSTIFYCQCTNETSCATVCSTVLPLHCHGLQSKQSESRHNLNIFY